MLFKKINYFLRMLSKVLDDKICPFCQSEDNEIVEKKYLVTSLRKCLTCNLKFKHPRDSESFFIKHYQKDYKTTNSFMSELPSDENLIDLISNNFSDNRSYKKYFDNFPLIKTNDQKIKIVEFGASWGYNIFKLVSQGFDAVGYELSVPRSQYGKDKLKINLCHKEVDIRKNNDIFFSNHVIEHLADIKYFVGLAREKLSNDGFFVAFCPNGSTEYKTREPDVYKVTWGFEHPNLLNYEFASHIFKENPYLILTGDWDFNESLIKEWDGSSQRIGSKKDGKELLIIARPNIKIGTLKFEE